MSDSAGSTTAKQTAESALISVLIRTKNRPVMLARALASVAGQDWPAVEVVIINDGDPLDAQMLEGFRGQLHDLRVVKPRKPGGRVKAANEGLEQAQGDYLIFLDDDDWFYPDHLQKLGKALDSRPEVSLAYTGVECQRWDEVQNSYYTVHEYNQPFDHAAFLIRNFIPMHAAMFRRELLQQGIRFDETLAFYEDWDFWMQILRYSGFIYVPGISACYYLGDGSGFGVEESSTGQQAAERCFFSKWREIWDTEELLLIVAYARHVPQLRQEAQELHQRMNEVYARLGKEEDRYNSLAELHREALQQHEKVLEFHNQERQKSEELLKAHQSLLASHESLSRDFSEQTRNLSSLQAVQEELSGLNQQISRQLGDSQQLVSSLSREKSQLFYSLKAAEARVQAVQQSTSWKLTAPLRFVGRLLKRALGREGRAAHAMPVADSAPVAAAEVAAADELQQQTGSVEQLPLSTAAETVSVSKYKLRNIRKADFGKLAASLDFPASGKPRVSVIIPVYNHLDLTLACLQSLSENPQTTSFEVIVVDDASADETDQVLSACKAIRYLRNSENAGFIRTCNAGAAQARGEYLLFLNNDTEVLENWLDPLVAVLDERADAGIAGSKLVYPSGHLQEAGACLRADGTVDLVGLNQDPRDPRFNYQREVDHCSGAALLIRAELFARFGGFDECYAPAYFEDCDLSLKVRQAGFRVIYQPASEVVHHLSVSTENLPGGKLAQINRNRELYLQRWGEELQARDRIRAIAFYLPQFHPIPENDAWWGEGFTEWTNVTRAKPVFNGHYQPHRPSELGYYDLRLEEVREQQAALARQYGLYGFCYYYYWFDGKRLLDRPLNDMLTSGKPDFPFCVCWANENWSRRWDGQEDDVLIAQNYNDESNIRFIRDLLPVLKDSRYIRINDRPLLLIYRAELIPGLKKAIAGWRRIVREEGLGELYLGAVESFSGVQDELSAEFDALIEFPPHGKSQQLAERPADLSGDFTGQLYDYRGSAENFILRRDTDPRLFRTVMPSWDNSARRQNAAHIHVGASPDLYRQWLSAMVQQTRQLRPPGERVVFINAWNEWAEGNHLEPDERFGREYLEATSDALGSMGCYQPDGR